jgi:hypothetical protein
LEDKKLLDEYIAHNTELPEEQKQILEGFRKSIYGKFIYVKSLSKFAIFKNIKDEKFYAVKGLGNTFEDLLPIKPIVVILNILPFKNQIIYDGFIEHNAIQIGSSSKKQLLKEYMQSKRNNKIITSLN